MERLLSHLTATYYPTTFRAMTEYAANFPRDWFEFPNPQNPKELFRCDLTWLTSYWNCTFGAGCKGIDKKFADHGCCSDGAYFFDKNDQERVTSAAKRLTKDIWQNYSVARRGSKLEITERGLDNDIKTKKINETCIFFNEADFDNRYFGCALHHLAAKEGRDFLETKPDICWQLPLRRSWETLEIGDSKYQVIVISEYTREAWGEGGADMDWYCTSNTEAHNSPVPLYVSNRSELIALMNTDAYLILKERCDAIMAARNSRKTKSLPILTIHPASKRS